MIVDSVLRIEIPELSKKQWEQLETKLTFVNDEGAVVSCYRRQITKGNYILPRGAWAFLPDSIRYKDRRTFPPMPKVKFKITLDDVEKDERFRGQKAAVAAMLEHEQGLGVVHLGRARLRSRSRSRLSAKHGRWYSFTRRTF